jgi:hypothetical protein
MKDEDVLPAIILVECFFEDLDLMDNGIANCFYKVFSWEPDSKDIKRLESKIKSKSETIPHFSSSPEEIAVYFDSLESEKRDLARDFLSEIMCYSTSKVLEQIYSLS